MVNKKKKASRSNKSSTDRNHVMIVVGFIVALLAVMLLVKGLSGMRYSEFAEDFIELHEQAATQIPAELQGYEVATLAGGCFRCIEQPFEQLDGVVEVIVGYAGGDIENPSYKQVSSGKTKHVETAQIYYDPDVISFRQLVDFYWVLIDPSDDG